MLLRNQLYAGIVDVPKYGVRNTRGDFAPLVSEEIFFPAQAVLLGRGPTPRAEASQSELAGVATTTNPILSTEVEQPTCRLANERPEPDFM